MSKTNVSETARGLKSYVDRLERLHEEKKGLGEDITEIFSEAKEKGFNPKIIREILKRRRMTRSELEDWDAELATYETNLDSVLD